MCVCVYVCVYKENNGFIYFILEDFLNIDIGWYFVFF